MTGVVSVLPELREKDPLKIVKVRVTHRNAADCVDCVQLGNR